MFETDGLLVHMTTCHGQFCNYQDAIRWYEETVSSSTLPPEIETDCGRWCSAYTFLHNSLPFVSFSFEGSHSGLALLYAATDDLWGEAQCAAVTDSSSTTRACCACSDPALCPFWNYPRDDAGYCGTPCDEDDDNCKKLAAGCGASVFDVSTNWGAQRCDEQMIRSGHCDLCKQPLWCDDPGNPFGFGSAIKGPEEWMHMFNKQDGGKAVGSRQCRWKSSQKQTFIDTMRTRYVARGELHGFDFCNLWNEVNFYVGPGDGGVKHKFWNNLMGLLYVRTSGDENDWNRMHQLHHHFAGLGVSVPMFAINGEGLVKESDGGPPVEVLEWWDPNMPVDILSPPYNFERVMP